MEAVSFKNVTKGMSRGSVANARWEWLPDCGACNTKTTEGKDTAGEDITVTRKQQNGLADQRKVTQQKTTRQVDERRQAVLQTSWYLWQFVCHSDRHLEANSSRSEEGSSDCRYVNKFANKGWTLVSFPQFINNYSKVLYSSTSYDTGRQPLTIKKLGLNNQVKRIKSTS